MAKGSGGKLNKSETVQVRFDPILKLAAELAAAKERRTLSSFTETAVEARVKSVQIARDAEGNPVDAYQVARECWHAEPIVQLTILADRYPDLLTLRERKIVDAVRFFRGSQSSQGEGRIVEKLLFEPGWAALNDYADGRLTFAELKERLKGDGA